MRPIPARAYVFIAITCLVAVPFLALGVQDVLGDEPPTVAFYIWALCVLLSLRPIRIATNVELSSPRRKSRSSLVSCFSRRERSRSLRDPPAS